MEITSAEGLPRLYNLVNYTRRQLHNIDQQVRLSLLSGVLARGVLPFHRDSFVRHPHRRSRST